MVIESVIESLKQLINSIQYSQVLTFWMLGIIFYLFVKVNKLHTKYLSQKNVLFDVIFFQSYIRHLLVPQDIFLFENIAIDKLWNATKEIFKFKSHEDEMAFKKAFKDIQFTNQETGNFQIQYMEGAGKIGSPFWEISAGIIITNDEQKNTAWFNYINIFHKQPCFSFEKLSIFYDINGLKELLIKLFSFPTYNINTRYSSVREILNNFILNVEYTKLDTGNYTFKVSVLKVAIEYM